jgi:hypothetical protein
MVRSLIIDCWYALLESMMDYKWVYFYGEWNTVYDLDDDTVRSNLAGVVIYGFSEDYRYCKSFRQWQYRITSGTWYQQLFLHEGIKVSDWVPLTHKPKLRLSSSGAWVIVNNNRENQE